MHKKFLDIIVEPQSAAALTYFPIREQGDNIITGLLYSVSSQRVYVIQDGVANMFPDFVSDVFFNQYSKEIDAFKTQYPNALIQARKIEESWSFSGEWEHFTEQDMNKTWGLTLEERYRDFLRENEVEEKDLPGKLILDAGCGNGTHTQNVALQGKTTLVGIDFSTSVYMAEARRKSDAVLYIRGDLQNPPFAPNTFDIIFSNGVIHHTDNTYKTFKRIVPLVKPGGTLYVWLYNRQGGFFWRIKRRAFDYLRMVVCRLPKPLQKFIVNVFTVCVNFLNNFIGDKQEYNTLKLNMWDSLTPRYRYYHEPIESWGWFLENNFEVPAITNWDTLYGYGIIGKKKLA